MLASSDDVQGMCSLACAYPSVAVSFPHSWLLQVIYQSLQFEQCSADELGLFYFRMQAAGAARLQRNCIGTSARVFPATNLLQYGKTRNNYKTTFDTYRGESVWMSMSTSMSMSMSMCC